MSKAPAKILRCDALMHAMNPGKEQKVRELLMAWKTDAISIAITQWRLFYETGAFDKNARISNAIQPVTN